MCAELERTEIGEEELLCGKRGGHGSYVQEL